MSLKEFRNRYLIPKRNYVHGDELMLCGSFKYKDDMNDIFIREALDYIKAKESITTSNNTNNIQYKADINIVLGTPDEEMYPENTEQLIRMLAKASKNKNIIIKTTVITPLHINSWASEIIKNFGTPGFRDMYRNAYMFHRTLTYSPERDEYVPSQHKNRMSPADMHDGNYCDNIIFPGNIKKSIILAAKENTK